MNGRQLFDFGSRGIGGVDERDKRYFLDCVNWAAAEFVRETRCLTGEAVITTVNGQNGYELPNDFLDLHVKDRMRRLVIKYTDSAGKQFPLPAVTMEFIFSDNIRTGSSSSPRPIRFSITDMPSPKSPVRGSATSSSQSDGGLSRLTDINADFSGISPRDLVHNITDGSDGIVIESVSGTELDIALFSGKKNLFTAVDVYVISPGTKKYLYLDPAPVQDGETVTVPYVAMPNPVYTDYASFRFDEQSARAVVYYGAYKFVTDYDLDFRGDMHLRAMFDEEVRRKKRELARNILQGSPMGGYRYR